MCKIKTHSLKIKKILPITLLIFTLISVFLTNNSIGYIKSFPIKTSIDINNLEHYKLLNKVFPRFETLSDKEKMTILNNYFQELIQNDITLKSNEIQYIKENFINKTKYSDYEQKWDQLYKISIENGTIEKFEKIRFNISYFSGMNLQDVQNKLSEIDKNQNLSFDFAYELADKIIILWSLFIYILVGYFFYIYRNKNSEVFIMTSPYNPTKYSLCNLLKIQSTILFLASLEYITFSLIIHNKIKFDYVSVFSDYLIVLFMIIWISIIFFISLAYFLNEVSKKIYITAPLYYTVCFSFITPTLEKSKLKILLPYIRRDMFTLIDKQFCDLLFLNRLVIFILTILLTIGIIEFFKKGYTRDRYVN